MTTAADRARIALRAYAREHGVAAAIKLLADLLSESPAPEGGAHVLPFPVERAS